MSWDFGQVYARCDFTPADARCTSVSSTVQRRPGRLARQPAQPIPLMADTAAAAAPAGDGTDSASDGTSDGVTVAAAIVAAAV